MIQCSFWWNYHASSSSYPLMSCLSFVLVNFFNVMFPAIALPCLRFPARTGSWSQSRLARLVAGPFWGWNCTGGRPSVHWNTSHNSFFHNQGRVDWLVVYRLTNWCIAYTDEIVFGEAAGCDVVLQELLGKVLVHLSSLVGVNGISTSLVEICWEKIIVSTADHVSQIWIWTSGDPPDISSGANIRTNVNWYKRKIKIRREIAFQFKEHVDTF